MPNQAHLAEPIIISDKPSMFTHMLAELRDELLQKDRMKFRFNAERASEIMAYELSKHLLYEEVEVTTPLGTASCQKLARQPVLTSILRAGLVMQNGFMRVFDQADNAFVSAYRKFTTSDDFVVDIEYTSMPDIEERTLILLDPMIATGRSMVRAVKKVLEGEGKPAALFIATIIASEEGIEYVRRNLPEARLFIGDVDSELTAKAYIVPGLGDAGDLAFGEKS
ncbi:MAG: uracil phosphoribosyltransferase [Bacteroidota bacterium]